MITHKVNKTKILPLRWFANFCNRIGSPHLIKMLRMQEELGINSGFIWNYHSFMWDWTYKVYKKWGTYYKVIKYWDDDVLKQIGSDYDKDGIPYWESNNYVQPWDFEDENTGDAFKIIRKKNK